MNPIVRKAAEEELGGCDRIHIIEPIEVTLTALKKDFTKEQLKETVAYQAMTRIGILYKVEELIKDKTPEERYQERQKQSRPVVAVCQEYPWCRCQCYCLQYRRNCPVEWTETEAVCISFLCIRRAS